ncbi:unnamed protein product [Camellia sinensis]
MSDGGADVKKEMVDDAHRNDMVGDVERAILEQKFDSVEDGEDFYNALWLCSREGQRLPKYLDRVAEKSRAPKALTRVGCKAQFRIRYDADASEGGKYVVTHFVADHNHELAEQHCHYVVICGYDAMTDEFEIRDPASSGKHEKVTSKRLEEARRYLWRRERIRTPIRYMNHFLGPEVGMSCLAICGDLMKKLSCRVLQLILQPSSSNLQLTELCEYAANVDIPIARESIRAVGKIALQQYDVNAIVDRLLQFLEMEKDYVTAETLVLVKDLLRKYLQWSHDCIAVVGNISSKNVQEPKAKAALIWMLGEYCQDMQDAPYVLESLIDSWDDEHSAELTVAHLVDAHLCSNPGKYVSRPVKTTDSMLYQLS